MNNILNQIKKSKNCYIMILPYFFLFFIFFVIPVVIAIYYSFTYYNLLQTPVFVGLQNYIKMFFADEIFTKSLINTLVLASVVGLGGYIGALLLAWMLNELSPKLRSFMVLLIYAPAISGNIYLVWSLIFSGDTYGYINGFLINFGIINTPIQFLFDPKYMMIIIIIVAVWMGMGVSFLAFVAGLQGVNPELYEAGLMDGIRNRWQELWFIIIPSMKPLLLFSAVMSITSSFGIGDVTVQLCGSPSTDYAVHTLVNHLTDYGTVRFNMGYACALAGFIFVLMVGTNKLAQFLLRKVGK